MTDVPDARLLEQLARNGSEEAFAALVQRHIAIVHSVALRHTATAQQAQDITQAVFVILARKAGTLGRKTVLPGWLYHTARLTAANLQRAETRRVRREQEAFMQSKLEESATDALWRELSPQLDEAMAGLGASERDALVLRYFQNKSMAEVGKCLGLAENTAQKRVSRALEKLRKLFTKRGVSSTSAILAGMISANSVQAAPVALAKTVTAIAVAKGAAASGSTLTLIKGALKIMAWTKAKTAIVGSAVVLLAAGTTTVTIKEIQEHRTYPWQVHEGLITFDQLNQPPQVRILHSTFHKPDEYGDDNKLLGTGVRAQDVIASAYGFVTPAKAILPAGLPADRYDYIACLRGGRALNEKALQEEVKRKFGVVGKIETHDTDVWLLKVKYPNAPALKRHKGPNNGNGVSPISGGFRFWNDGMDFLVASFEFRGNAPVIDGTGLSNTFDFDLNCSEADLVNRDLDAVNQALGPLGLELIPTNMPIEMLVVEKVK